MKRVFYTLILTTTLLLTSCEGFWNSNQEQQENDVEQTDSLVVDTGEREIRGIAIDGSRRNIYVAVQGDTMDFELSPDVDVDFSWEIGDSVMVKYYTTQYGDSVSHIATLLQ